jgi:hypothetical protein
MKPIRVFWSPLSRRFYASRAYKEIKPGVVEITGAQFDVTDDIAGIIDKHQLVFSREAVVIEIPVEVKP